MAEACAGCGTEFLFGARFCHACGSRRAAYSSKAPAANDFWGTARAKAHSLFSYSAEVWERTSFPAWMQYLHFHEIQRRVGLPTASLVSFMIGLGCVAGAIGVSLFYKASNLAEFQAIQMWRIEWLLAATASFVAGILLKKPSRD